VRTGEVIGLLDDSYVFNYTIYNFGNTVQMYGLSTTSIPNADTIDLNVPAITVNPFESGRFSLVISASDLGYSEFDVIANSGDTVIDISCAIRVVDPPKAPEKEMLSIVNDHNIFLSWKREADVNYYKVYRSTSPIDDVTGLSYRKTYNHHFYDKDMQNGTYYYAVVAVSIYHYESNVSDCYEINVTAVLILPEEVKPQVVSDYLTFMVTMFAIIGAVMGVLGVMSRMQYGRKFWEDENLVKFSKTIKKLHVKPDKILKTKMESEAPPDVDFEQELTAEELALLDKIELSGNVKSKDLKEAFDDSLKMEEELTEEELDLLNNIKFDKP
jgi:hypothetical protein